MIEKVITSNNSRPVLFVSVLPAVRTAVLPAASCPATTVCCSLECLATKPAVKNKRTKQNLVNHFIQEHVINHRSQA